MSQIDHASPHITSNMTGPRNPTAGRIILAAALAAFLLPTVYFAFPPIFADRSRSRAPDLAQQAGDSGSFPELPEIPLTPSIKAQRRQITLIQQGVRRMRQIPAYTALFTKTEMVDGELTGEQTMHLKLRREPFSIYLRWITGEPGQELLYVAGQNDGKMLVRAGGFEGIFGAIRIDVDGALAMSEARYPITDLGLLNLSERVLEYRYREAGWRDGYTCTARPSKAGGRPCYLFTMIYDSPKRSPDYRKSQIWIDREYQVVTKVRNYGWPDEGTDSPTEVGPMIEKYTYTKIDFSPDLAPVAFNAANENYRLLRR